MESGIDAGPGVWPDARAGGIFFMPPEGLKLARPEPREKLLELINQ
jgi:hypothetical protein